MKQSALRTQVNLADALEVDQRTISRMINGKVPVTVERVAQIERLCQLPAGQILRWAGYVADTSTPEVLSPNERDARVSPPKPRASAGRKAG